MAESISDRVDELLQPANTKKGDALPDEVANLRPTCTMAEENYQAILGHIKTMKEAEAILCSIRTARSRHAAEHPLLGHLVWARFSLI